MSDLKLSKVYKTFGAVDIIKGVDLDIEKGEFVVFVGPSGCGKSTLLRLVSGLEGATSGQIVIAGRDVTNVPPAKRGIAMVFQSYALFPHMTVADNITFGLRLAGTEKAEVEKRLAEVANILQITPLLDRRPKQLSGGQRQRVAIGRAIIRNPDVFLFDEPLSNLDAALRVQMRLEIARLHRQLGATMIYVTHDQVEAMTLADRIVVLNGGRIEQVGTPIELYEAPANRFVAQFIGSPKMNFFSARMVAEDAGHVVRLGAKAFRLADSAGNPGDEADIGIRPEHLTIADDGKKLFDAEVSAVERLGSESIAYLQAAASKELVAVKVAASTRLKEGEIVPVAAADSVAVHIFDTHGARLSSST